MGEARGGSCTQKDKFNGLGVIGHDVAAECDEEIGEGVLASW